VSSDQTLEDRVTRLEQLVDRAIAYGRKTPLGRAVLAKMGLDTDA
jgi:hypothetical protein